jgi:hypothetical protein
MSDSDWLGIHRGPLTSNPALWREEFLLVLFRRGEVNRFAFRGRDDDNHGATIRFLFGRLERNASGHLSATVEYDYEWQDEDFARWAGWTNPSTETSTEEQPEAFEIQFGKRLLCVGGATGLRDAEYQFVEAHDPGLNTPEEWHTFLANYREPSRR